MEDVIDVLNDIEYDDLAFVLVLVILLVLLMVLILMLVLVLVLLLLLIIKYLIDKIRAFIFQNII